MRRLFVRSTLPLACLFVSACGNGGSAPAARTPADSARADAIARATQDSVNRAQPGYVIDSIHPPAEEMRRFRAAFPGDSATTLVGGSTSRDALVRRFVKALVANDTAALRAMAVHGREFADLYYPDSPYAHPPYRQPPSFAWRMIQGPGSAGLTRLIRRLGGKPMAYVGVACDPSPLREGRTTRYAGCLIRIIGPAGNTATKRYFGSIVEHGGQYKFLSYTNDF